MVLVAMVFKVFGICVTITRVLAFTFIICGVFVTLLDSFLFSLGISLVKSATICFCILSCVFFRRG